MDLAPVFSFVMPATGWSAIHDQLATSPWATLATSGIHHYVGGPRPYHDSRHRLRKGGAVLCGSAGTFTRRYFAVAVEFWLASRSKCADASQLGGVRPFFSGA